jgi:hypothetical protein
MPTPEWMSAVNVRALRPSNSLPGEPFSLSWLDLALSIQE